MPDYPFKLRVIRRGGRLWLEELARGRGGRYFIKDRVMLPNMELVPAAESVKLVQGFGINEVSTPINVVDTSDIPGIGD